MTSLHSIPDAHKSRYLYHFTHLNNLESILREAAIHSKSKYSSIELPPIYSIANHAIQGRRSVMPVTCAAPKTVHDYVPLYFCTMSPMILGLIKRKAVDQQQIVYFEFKIDLLLDGGVVFTDSAANGSNPPQFYSSISDLDRLDWTEIDSIKWKSTNPQKRMAEVLYPDSLQLQKVSQIVVWNESARRYIEKICGSLNTTIPNVEFENHNRRHFYMKFFDPERSTLSLAAGPIVIQNMFEQACKDATEILIGSRDGMVKEYTDFKSLLQKFRDNFSSVGNFSSLETLKPGYHDQSEISVADHSKKVAQNVREHEQFGQLRESEKTLVELAAFLHDVGKGSNFIKPDGSFCQDDDHNLYALPIVVDLLKMVETFSVEDAHLLLKLVAYSDLLGDIMGKDRPENQLTQVVKSFHEYQLLKILSNADINATHPKWWTEGEHKLSMLEAKLKAHLIDHREASDD